MSTAGQVRKGDLAPCWHCRGAVHFESRRSVRLDGPYVVCGKCGVCGPVMETELEAMQAWNGVSMLGRVGIVHGKAGIPNQTTALAEHLRLLSEQVACGAYENPDAFVVILVTSKNVERVRVHASTHNIDADGVAHVCQQVHQSAHVRSSLKRISTKPQ